MTASSQSSSNDGVSNLQRRFTAAKMVTTDVTRRMVCGGLAGMIAKTATNPLERIKMLSQTGEGNKTAGRPTIMGLYRNILQKEGVLGLWAGNGANLLRVFPAKSVVFSCNDYYRALFSRILQTEQLPAPVSFLAGGLSGMTATAVTYPLDLARGRISGKLATSKGHKVYRGITQTLFLTVREEGVAALFRGITPTIIGALPYEGIKFGTVGIMERIFPREDSTISTPVRKMIFGGLGGVMAGLITYPNDTVRRMLQLQGSRGNSAVYSGYWDCVRQIYGTHGISRFYHGLTINTIRMAPNTALQFYFYSLLKQWTDGLSK